MLLSLLSELRVFIVTAYIYIFGVRFYSSTTFPVGDEIQSFVAKTINGQTITFRFYRENCNFTQYVFNKLRHRVNVMYVVIASYDDDASEDIRCYGNVRIFMNATSLWLFSEAAITKALLRAYVDFISVEFDRRKKNKRVEVDRRKN